MNVSNEVTSECVCLGWSIIWWIKTRCKYYSSTVQHLRTPIDLHGLAPISSPINTCCHLLFFFHTKSTGSTALLSSGSEEASSEQRSTPVHHKTRASQQQSRMSRGGLDLKLHLSPPAPAIAGAERASSDEEWSSSPSSCLSSEGEREPHRLHHGLQWSDSPEATPMVLAACPRCLMYVMLSEADPRCPRCRSPVLLDFLHHAAGGGRGSNGEGREGGGRNSSRGGRRNRRA